MTLDVLIEAREALKASLDTLRDKGPYAHYLRVMTAEIRLGFEVDKLTAKQMVEVAA